MDQDQFDEIVDLLVEAGMENGVIDGLQATLFINRINELEEAVHAPKESTAH